MYPSCMPKKRQAIDAKADFTRSLKVFGIFIVMMVIFFVCLKAGVFTWFGSELVNYSVKAGHDAVVHTKPLAP
jgi:Na+/H+ antiporter NhaD/arsenite permease-like protein